MKRWVTLVVGAVGLLAPGKGSAQMIALESYSDRRPEDAADLLAPLLDEVGQRGFTVNGDLSEQVDARFSIGTRGLQASEIDEVRRLTQDGTAQYREASYEQSIQATERAVRLLESAPLTMVRNQSARDLMFDALVYLALSNGRLGRPVAATRAMAELVRSFPDKEISHARHGPEPLQLYRQVKADLRNQGVGRLTITLDDPRSVVFVNERYVGVGTTVMEDLLPGRYRVFVQQGERAGRRHEVDVEAGSDASIDVVWGIDGALKTEPDLVGFVFGSEADRAAHEAGYSIRVARALNATGVAVVGVREYHGRRSIVGTLFSSDSGRPVRTAALAIEPVAPSEEQVRAMARFLAGDESAAKMFPNLASPETQHLPDAEHSPRRDLARPYRLWKWVGLLGGVAAIGTGVTLIAIHQPDTVDGRRNETARNTRTPGIIATACGGVLALTGAYFWVRDRRDGRRSTVAVVPTAGGLELAIMGQF